MIQSIKPIPINLTDEFRKVDKIMKKSLFLAVSFFVIISLLGGCSPKKTDEEILQEDYVKNEIEQKPTISSGQGISTESQTEEKVDKSVKQEKTVEGYVLNTDGNIITVDLENSDGRNYPQEGLDRGIEFDITNAEKEVIPTSGYSENMECRIRTGLTVSITYYEESGKNIVTKISTDNDEKEMIVYVSSGMIQELTEETITIHVDKGDNNGENIVFNMSETSIPQEASENSLVSVTYYMKENTYYAVSVICIA